jgi:TP901 family phage tail tape measure protein
MVDDVNANIGVNIDTSSAIASLKNLQREISLFHTQMARGGATANAQAAQLQSSLLNAVNATGQFQASMTRVNSTTEAFTTALEKNKLTMGQYFRYAGGASKTFGRAFKSEFDTISKVAVERVKDLQTQYISMGRDANGALQSIKIRPLTLDMQDLTTKTMVAAQKQQLFNQLLTQGSTNLLNFGKNTQWAGRQLMVGFTLPLTLFATTAAKSFMEIEKQVIKIRRVYGDFSTTVEETDKMIESIKSLATEYTKYGVAVKDTIGLASEAAAAGKTGQELLAQVAEATRLAVLGNVDQSQALETTMSITNAFGVATEDLANKIDFLNAVENQSVTSIEDLTEAIPKAGPVVKQLGGDVEDLAFFLTAMKEGGINASEGANALKSGLAALINPTGKAKEMLEGFGINIDKIVNSNKGDVKGLVIDFAEALDTLDPLDRARAIEQLFGKFQFSRLSTLFQNVIGEGTQASRVLELTKATTQELAILSQRELKKVENTTTYKFEKAFADFQAALAPVGEAFLKAVTPIIEFGTKLLNQFNSMGDGAKSFTVILTTVVAGIGPVLLMTVGLVANGVANLIKMFQLLGGIFKKTGADTGILGVQTDYMTQQQIEAAAVAASLNQSHSRLTQTFSVEAAALNSLTAAYQKAITAQRGFSGAGSVGRSSTKPKKYAKGVVSVPGPKGKGDVVPAMLAPGEAVIPAAMAKKYAPLINGMVAGNIPGYEQGLKTYTNATMYLPSKMNSEMRPGGAGVDPSKLASAIKGGGAALQAPLLDALARSMGATTQSQIQKMIQDNPDLKQIAGRISTGIATEVGSMTGKVKDADLEKVAKKNIRANVKGTQFSAAAEDFLTRKTTFEDPTVKRLKGTSRGKGRLEPIGRSPIDAGGAGYRQRSPGYKRIFEMLGGKNASNYDLAHLTPAETIPASQVKGTSTELKAAQTNIKNKKQQISLGKDPVTGRNLGRITVPVGMPSSEILALREAERAKAISSTDKAPATRRKKAPATQTLTPAQNAPVTQTLTPAQKGAETRKRNTEAKSQAVADAQAKRDATNARRREQYAEQRAAKQAAAQPEPKKPGIGSRIASGVKGIGPMGGMMAAGAVGMGVSMIPGMEGLGMAISTVGPLLMMLPGPIGLAVAALGLLGAGVFALVQAQEEQRKKAIELGNAQVMSIGSMNKMAEEMGTVSATQAREAEMSAKLTGVKEEELAAGQQYLRDTAGGQKILADIKALESSGESTEQIAQTVASNLANAVAQNVITKEQGQEIIAALGVETGNLGISTRGAIDFATYTQDLTKTSSVATRDSLTQATENFNSVDSGSNQWSGLTEFFFGNGRVTDRDAARTASTATINTYGQAVGGTDSINSQFDAKVAEAATEEEILRLNEQRTVQLEEQRKIQAEAFEAIKGQKIALGAADFNSNFLTNIETQFSKDSDMYKTAEKINNLGDTEFKTMIQTQLASGTLSPASVEKIMTIASEDKDFESDYSVLISTVGEPAALALVASLTAAGASDRTTTRVYSVVTDISQKDPERANAIIAGYEGLAEAAAAGMDIDINTIGLETAEKVGGLLERIGDKKEIETDLVLSADDTSLDNYGKWKAFLGTRKKISRELAIALTAKGPMGIFNEYLQAKYGWSKSTANATITGIGSVVAGAMANSDEVLNWAEETYVGSSGSDSGGTDAVNDGGGGGGGGGTPQDAELERLNKEKDKQQKALNVFALKEEAINKIYDERKKSLEEIAKINSNIADKQKSQLTIANALASGDIAAAARAVQESRAKASSYAQEEQMRALEAKRQAELDGIIVNGKTKEAYEAEIAKLNLKIAERELALATGASSTSGGGGRGGGGSSPRSPSSPPSPPSPPAPPAPPAARTVNPAYTAAVAKRKPLQDQIKTIDTKIASQRTIIAQALRDFRENKISAGAKDVRIQKANKEISTLNTTKGWLGRSLSLIPLPPQYLANGGQVKMGGFTTASGSLNIFGKTVAKKANGGMINYLAGGGDRFKNPSLGSDTVPAMLTPGEFVIRRPAVKGFGVKNLEKINSGQSLDGSVYNYNISLNVSSVSSPEQIARTVITKIKDIDKQRIRGNGY